VSFTMCGDDVADQRVEAGASNARRIQQACRADGRAAIALRQRHAAAWRSDVNSSVAHASGWKIIELLELNRTGGHRDLQPQAQNLVEVVRPLSINRLASGGARRLVAAEVAQHEQAHRLVLVAPAAFAAEAHVELNP
jgi:hypothetical protein